MEFVYSTGGREKYFNALNVGDCVTRAICNATGKDYKEVYDALKEFAKREHLSKRKHHKSSVRNGVYIPTERRYLDSIGWKWIPLMFIGSGCKVHLSKDELPSGTLIVSVSKHLTCVKDGVIYDTYNCSRDESRCVYGYYVRMSDEELKARDEQNRIAQELIAKQNKAIEETKLKEKAINDKYHKELMNYIKKEKLYHHKRVLLENKIKREIALMRKQDGDKFVNDVLTEEDKRIQGE